MAHTSHTSTDPRIAGLDRESGVSACADCDALFRPQFAGDDLCGRCSAGLHQDHS